MKQKYLSKKKNSTETSVSNVTKQVGVCLSEGAACGKGIVSLLDTEQSHLQ